MSSDAHSQSGGRRVGIGPQGEELELLRLSRSSSAKFLAAVADLAADHWAQAAQGIMTTDTVPKAASMQCVVGGQRVTVTGISKGAGMIRPNMATMLGFIATDAAVPPDLLQSLVREAADESFNRITIDGDTSTNDSFVIMASAKAGHAPDRKSTRLNSSH